MARARQVLPGPRVEIHETGAGQECIHLVYKHGCNALRKGTVEVMVFLDDDGQVRDSRTLRNTITRDPEPVERCVHRSIKKRRWKPPLGVSLSFVIHVSLSERC